MNNDNQVLQKAFNDHFDEFINDIVTLFPDNIDIRSAKTSIQMLRKANPKILIGVWNKYISTKYSTQIGLTTKIFMTYFFFNTKLDKYILKRPNIFICLGSRTIIQNQMIHSLKNKFIFHSFI